MVVLGEVQNVTAVTTVPSSVRLWLQSGKEKGKRRISCGIKKARQERSSTPRGDMERSWNFSAVIFAFRSTCI